MKLTKKEKISYIGAPWLFAIVLIICGTYISWQKPGLIQGIILIVAGLICMSLYCISSLLVKIIEKE